MPPSGLRPVAGDQRKTYGNLPCHWRLRQPASRGVVIGTLSTTNAIGENAVAQCRCRAARPGWRRPCSFQALVALHTTGSVDIRFQSSGCESLTPLMPPLALTRLVGSITPPKKPVPPDA